jgi:hypothetical protein
MDETSFKPICPYNIILFAQSKIEVGGNISICESCYLGFLGIFLSEWSPQLLEVIR